MVAPPRSHELARTAVVYRRRGATIVIALMSLHPLTYRPCDVHRALLHSPPGSSRVQGSGIDSVQIAPIRSTYRYIQHHNKDITPLPGFGIDRMLDFGWLGSASLWKSGPLFSTGTKEAELMVRELRVEPAVAAAPIGGRASLTLPPAN